MSGEGKTILVIDDEPSVLELITDIFSDAQFKVMSALSPTAGIAHYREHHQDINLVLLDYSMPEMNGIRAFEELVRINKNVPILMCSGYSEEDMASAFGVSRPAGFVHKPYNPMALLQRVSGML